MKGERGRDERRKEEDSKQKRKEENLDFEHQEANMCKKICEISKRGNAYVALFFGLSLRTPSHLSAS